MPGLDPVQQECLDILLQACFQALQMQQATATHIVPVLNVPQGGGPGNGVVKPQGQADTGLAVCQSMEPGFSVTVRPVPPGPPEDTLAGFQGIDRQQMVDITNHSWMIHPGQGVRRSPLQCIGTQFGAFGDGRQTQVSC